MNSAVADNVRNPNAVALLADLRATFPGIHATQLSDFTALHGPGVFVGGDAVPMPDGLPLWLTIAPGDPEAAPEYDGYLHTGFESWLAARGWCIETYDVGAHMIIPLTTFERSSAHL